MIIASLVVKPFHHFLFISPICGTASNNLSFQCIQESIYLTLAVT